MFCPIGFLPLRSSSQQLWWASLCSRLFYPHRNLNQDRPHLPVTFASSFVLQYQIQVPLTAVLVYWLLMCTAYLLFATDCLVNTCSLAPGHHLRSISQLLIKSFFQSWSLLTYGVLCGSRGMCSSVSIMKLSLLSSHPECLRSLSWCIFFVTYPFLRLDAALLSLLSMYLELTIKWLTQSLTFVGKNFDA